MEHWNPVAMFLCQVLGIIVLTVPLLLTAVSIVLAFGGGLFELDPTGIVPMVIATFVPLGCGWWLYARALRHFSSRLELAVPSKTLRIPLVGGFHLISAILDRR